MHGFFRAAESTSEQRGQTTIAKVLTRHGVKVQLLEKGTVGSCCFWWRALGYIGVWYSIVQFFVPSWKRQVAQEGAGESSLSSVQRSQM